MSDNRLIFSQSECREQNVVDSFANILALMNDFRESTIHV